MECLDSDGIYTCVSRMYNRMIMLMVRQAVNVSSLMPCIVRIHADEDLIHRSSQVSGSVDVGAAADEVKLDDETAVVEDLVMGVDNVRKVVLVLEA